jgi:transposase, IS30 family
MARHLTLAERDLLAQLLHEGYQQNEIAQRLQRSPSCISRELGRNSTGGTYHAGQAHERAQQRRRQRKLTRKMDRPEIQQFVTRGLASYWSPDEIAGRIQYESPDQSQRHIGRQTIYQWIEQQEPTERVEWKQGLRRRGKRPRKQRQNAEESAQRAAIASRPAVINQRQRIGDFEGDTVLGPAGTGGLVTLVDRRSRFTILTKIKDKQARRVRRRIEKRLRGVHPQQRLSITFDQGTEFADCQRLEINLGLQLYFAEPGRPYQRGTNENTNGLVRQFYPKGTDFREVSHAEVARIETLLNDRPRACLGYRTPREVFFEQPAHSGCD